MDFQQTLILAITTLEFTGQITLTVITLYLFHGHGLTVTGQEAIGFEDTGSIRALEYPIEHMLVGPRQLLLYTTIDIGYLAGG